jgi:cytochrome c biogenesis protein CcmG/thiol:disulfide interchange protein DsbE
MNFIPKLAAKDAVRILAVAAVTTATLLAQPVQSAVLPGQTAPVFELAGPAGAVRLDHYQGKLVYLDFWASWCGPCRHSFPWMNEMQTKYGPQGLQVVGINVDARTDDARSFLAATPARFVIAFDPAGAAPRQYGIKGMPSSVLIGPDGKVLFEHSGFREADRVELESRIRAALGAKK